MIEIPTQCPSCNSDLERVKDQLFCRNKTCKDQLKNSIINYAKVIGIKGLGPASVEKLGITSIEEIYTIDNIEQILGEKLGKKLIENIEQSKVLELPIFLAGCSIPLIGLATAKKFTGIINEPSEITLETCEKAGLGEKATKNILKWYDSVDLSTLPIKFKQTTKQADNINVCITGKIPGYTKTTLAKYLEKYNINVLSNVTKKTNYLISNDNKDSTKKTKAKNLGIEIITLEELVNRRQNETNVD